MDYSKACKTLNFNENNTKERNAKLAASTLRNLAVKAPLKFKVACKVLIQAAQ